MSVNNEEVLKSLSFLLSSTAREKENNIKDLDVQEFYKISSGPYLTAIYKQLQKMAKTDSKKKYDIDECCSLLDDIINYQNTNPVVERIHMNLETAMHNRIFDDFDEYTIDYKQLMYTDYIIRNIESNLIKSFISILEEYIESCTSEKEINLLNKLKDSIQFKYNLDIEINTITIPTTEEEIAKCEQSYLECVIVKCLEILSNYTDNDLNNTNKKVMINALSLYLKAATSNMKDKYQITIFSKLHNKIIENKEIKKISIKAFINEEKVESEKPKALVKEN